MKKIGKWIAIVVLSLIVLITIAVSYIVLALPDVGKPENIQVALTPQRIARGEYLANHVALCTDCHSQRDWSKFAGPVNNGLIGEGGEIFDAKVGFPGDVHVPNITPYNLKSWSDGEIFRAITTGVRKDGSAIFPLMPWPYYSKMNREDIYSIIAYLRTLKSIETSYPKVKLNFPLNILVHTMPQKAELGELPATADTLRYGAYLTRSAACMECHSQDNKGKIIPELEFAGGHEYMVNGKTIKSANITPDKNTGIGNWTRETFVARFKSFNNPSKAVNLNASGDQTIMPWYDYGGMSESDLKSIYAYLRTVKPVNNKVVVNN
jgi:cytochrome c553